MEMLQKNKFEKNNVAETSAHSSCCGGTPSDNPEACCKLDEQKKAEGEKGCGCNSGNAGSTCC